jgi:hypothetical protein
MESFLGTLIFASFALGVAFACGYGPVTLLLPAEHGDLRWVAMPATGYLCLCLLVMVISGNLYLPVTTVVVPAFAILVVLGAAVFAWQLRRGALGPARPQIRRLAILMVPTLLIVTGPTLIQSAELYLGSANLDFYQSLIYQEVLRRYDLSVFGIFAAPMEAHSLQLSTKVWPESPQARFGGVMFSYLLQSLTGLSPKSTLTVSLVVFAACAPLSFYFFSRVVMGLPERGAVLCALLVGISSPLALGFLYILVGQGSGLPILPLLISVLFMSMRQSSPRLLAYAAVLVAGLFWLYALMLPFALAPMGLVAVYLMVRRRLSFWWALAILLGVAAGMLLAWAGMFEQLMGFFRGLAEVSGRLVGTFFFVDFLTEMFFVYLLGITTYPASNSILSGTVYQLVGDGVAWRVTVTAATAVLVFYLASFAAWMRNQADDARRAAMIAIAAVYAAVWAYFTFMNPYGYSAFKMTAWLQFLVIPVMAFGLLHFWQSRAATGPGRIARWAVLTAGFFFVGSNFVASIDYGVMSFGKNRERGYVVNAFGLSNNADVPSLGAGVSTVVDRKSRVGLSFTDSIQNNWTAHQLMGRMPHSILSHEQLPEDDAFLPDPISGEVRDTSGVLKRAKVVTYEDVRNDYYLLPGPGNLNPEITLQPLPKPVWGNDTYQLQAGTALSDFLYLGRGFYRSEFPRSGQPWWQPQPSSRWSRDGGEFYLLQASRPGEPYRLKLTAMVGFGLPDASRTLELYHGRVKFDEIRISSTARMISKPFYPAGKLDKVTVVIREKTRPMKRRAGLWNMGLPDDTRSLNMQVSSAQVIGPDYRPAAAFAGGRISGNDILDKAYLFDGVSVDGWVGPRASLAFVSPVDAKAAVLEVIVPGDLGFTFPFTVTVLAGGVEHRFAAKHPGRLALEVPLREAAKGEIVSLEIRPQSYKDIDDPFARQNRPILQSVHLESIEFTRRP